MPKRVHELAKELNVPTKELINIMSKQNINDKKTMSNVSDAEISKVKGYLAGANNTASASKPASAPAPKPAQSAPTATAPQPSATRPKDSGQRPQSDRPQGQRPQDGAQRQHGDRPQGQRPQGDRPQGQRPQGDRPQGQRPQGDRPQGQRPQGDRPQGQRPQGDRPQGQRPQGDRPQGQRPQGDRPQGQRPQGDRPQGQRPQGDRPQGQRPQGQRPQGDRPQGQRPQGERPQGQRPHGDRPQGQRPHGDRPQGQRPQGTGSGYQGNRPQGSGGGAPRPASGGFGAPAGGPPSGKQNTNNRWGNNKPGAKPGQNQYSKRRRPLDGEMTATQKKKEKRKAAKKEAERLELEAIEAAKLAENDVKTIQVGELITVSDLAQKLGKSIQEIIMPLMKIGIMASINHKIDYHTAAKIAEEHDILVEPEEELDILEATFGDTGADDDNQQERPPVVVVMGHVDHGKTSLLDAIRSSAVADREAGGITQSIGAYQVNINDKKVTFLDTPGHEAFTAMRMRGAQVTDIAILVVAADDGVMPQTIEAINHARAAGVEIIVAINKIDRPQANPDKVKTELAEHGISPVDWGGSTECVHVSAKQRIGIEELLETVLLVAEMKELKASPTKRVMGTVIEAKLDKGRGTVATVLIQEGTLSRQAPIVVGKASGRVRGMFDHMGERIETAGPSTPVEITGLTSVPEAGDTLYVADSEKQAGQLASSMIASAREKMIKQSQKVSLDDLFNQIQAGNVKDLNIIIKADVQGSVEALRNSLERLSNDEVRVRIIHGGVGQITESDISLASASNAIIIGFSVIASPLASQLAQAEKVDVRLYRIIYNAIEDIEVAMKGMLDPVFEEKIIGHAEIRQIFTASGTVIAGSYVTDGKIQRNAKARVMRRGKAIHDGELGALKRFKDDAKEVAAGYECGISFVKFNDLELEDVIEVYVMEEVPR